MHNSGGIELECPLYAKNNEESNRPNRHRRKLGQTVKSWMNIYNNEIYRFTSLTSSADNECCGAYTMMNVKWSSQSQQQQSMPMGD